MGFLKLERCVKLPVECCFPTSPPDGRPNVASTLVTVPKDAAFATSDQLTFRKQGRQDIHVPMGCDVQTGLMCPRKVTMVLTWQNMASVVTGRRNHLRGMVGTG